MPADIPAIKARRLRLAEVVGALRAGRALVTNDVMAVSQSLANWSEGVDFLLADPDIDKALADIPQLVTALEEAQRELRESAEFWEDNMDGLLETALTTGATAVVEDIDGFYSTSNGELRIAARILKGE